MLIALCTMRARCLSTEGYKHSMVLRHLTQFGHTASQNLPLAHRIHPSRLPEPNVVMKAGFHFVFNKAMSNLEPAFTYICIYLEKISKALSYIVKKITANYFKKLLLLQTDYICSLISRCVRCSHDLSLCFLYFFHPLTLPLSLSSHKS